jgi:hypothetical protein
VNLADPAFLIALAIGILGFVVYARLQPRPPKTPECLECGETMERGEPIPDPEHPEHRFIPGEREAYFKCPRCGRQVRARY